MMTTEGAVPACNRVAGIGAWPLANWQHLVIPRLMRCLDALRRDGHPARHLRHAGRGEGGAGKDGVRLRDFLKGFILS